MCRSYEKVSHAYVFLLCSRVPRYTHIIWRVSSQYKFYFTASSFWLQHFTVLFIPFHIMCYSNRVSLLCLLLVLLFVLNSFWTKKKTRFLLKSLLLLSIGVFTTENGGKKVSISKGDRQREHNTVKYVVKRLQTTIPIGIFEFALTKKIFVHIRKKTHRTALTI